MSFGKTLFNWSKQIPGTHIEGLQYRNTLHTAKCKNSTSIWDLFELNGQQIQLHGTFMADCFLFFQTHHMVQTQLSVQTAPDLVTSLILSLASDWIQNPRCMKMLKPCVQQRMQHWLLSIMDMMRPL